MYGKIVAFGIISTMQIDSTDVLIMEILYFITLIKSNINLLSGARTTSVQIETGLVRGLGHLRLQEGGEKFSSGERRRLL